MNKKRILILLTVLAIVMSMVTFAYAAPDAGNAASDGAPAVTTAQPTEDGAAAADGGAEPLPWYAGIGQFLPLILIVVVFYFVLIRPENKRKKETASMRESLKTGDEITTIGGIVGRITNIKDEELTIETGSDRNKMRIMKWAVSSVSSKNSGASEKKEEKKSAE